MRVTQQQFYSFIWGAPFDIVSSVDGPYPYTTRFETRNRVSVGKIVHRYEIPGTLWPITADYFLENF